MKNRSSLYNKYIVFIIALICFFFCNNANQDISLRQTETVMKRVAKWQMKNPKHELYDWTNGVLYAGVLAAYEQTKDTWYYSEAKKMGEANNWIPGKRYRHADDQIIGLTYLNLYRYDNNTDYFQSLKDSIDKMMTHPYVSKHLTESIDWWWCDALFMSPPVFAQLYSVTGENSYAHYMDSLWLETYELLYNQDQHLFARDIRYIPTGGEQDRLEQNGELIFWSRGNGWVMGGLCQILDILDEDYVNYDFYKNIYLEMAPRIANLQLPDGMWRTSLLDPDSYPGGESSGTGFFCYALAWGVNKGWLPKEVYEPVVEKAWSALLSNVDHSGRLGWVQPIGFDPKQTSPDNWEVYGTGAFLFAGAEMLKLFEEPIFAQSKGK